MDLQIRQKGTVKWPFQVDYDKVREMQTDVLVIGAGAAGSCAGIAAAKSGADVIVCEKGASRRAGNCGAGIDHWNDIPKSPDPSKSLSQRAEAGNMGNMNRAMIGHKGPAQSHRDYIAESGTWDILMELEKMGLPIRDGDGDFEGTPARDDKTGLLKAYNYAHMDTVRLRGGNFILPVLNKELRKSGAKVIDRVMMTGLLTEGGRQGAGVCGAMGFSTETGEFYVIRAKAVILASGYVCGNWIFSTEITGNSYRWDPNDIGEGLAMAYLAGAKTISFFSNGSDKGSHPFAWPRFGVGSNANTWFPCSIVDNNGKEVPWKYADGRTAETFEESKERRIRAAVLGGSQFRPRQGKTAYMGHDGRKRRKDTIYDLRLLYQKRLQPRKTYADVSDRSLKRNWKHAWRCFLRKAVEERKRRSGRAGPGLGSYDHASGTFCRGSGRRA